MPQYWERTLERKLDRRGFLALVGAAGAATALIACGGDSDSSTAAADNRPSTWVEATHGNVDPDFATVFPGNAVNQIRLTIGKDDWQAMLDDMTALFGNRGTGGGFGPGGGQMQQPPGGNQQPGQMQQPPGNFQQGGPAATATKKPMWVAGDLSFNGQTWTKVGIRFKGNSSLRQSWSTASDRMPFKLDFDQWEGDFPEIDNQRFYGFKQLSLSNNVGDATGMRETLAYDVFEAAGLPAANTAFCEVILDRGEGETSLGIYTVIEVVDDTVVDRVFGSDEGNIYEAEGAAAALTPGTASAIRTSFQKENNEDGADWSDVEKFVSILNSDRRVSDLAGWRKDLEGAFNVPNFLEFLAIATTLQHWDTYGGMTHNYYLYNDDGQLQWISWDHNFILGAMGGGGNQPNQQVPNQQAQNQQQNRGGMAGRMNTTFDKKEVTAANWPLIRYLMDVPDYYDAYRKYLKETIDGPFNAAKMQAKYEAWAKLLQPYYEKQNQGAAFQTAVQSLIDVTKQRSQAVSDFLAL